MSSTPPVVENPYVGPRPFRKGEDLYGRDRELRRIVDQLLAERIVLLYSPSGAGKTSLIQAALIPALLARDLHPLPVVRVNQAPRQGTDVDHVPPSRYVLSTLQSLEERLPEEQRRSEEALSELTLSAYLDDLDERCDRAPHSVLIFDQFEEILTADPTDLPAKREFFAQLGQALLNPQRWALIAMREDYVAALDPYKRAIPGRLSTVVRLDLLDETAASAAIRNPALHASDPGVYFEDDAVADLVDNLRRVRIQAGSTVEERLGPFIEPVQLQVVCRRLWQNQHPAPGAHISKADLVALGDVESALAGYYADRVHEVAHDSGISERQIREWIEEQLITQQGLRGQVMQGETDTEGLDKRAVELLKGAYLVRSEVRRGVTWLELAHDRLVDPVRANNAAYRDRLHPLVRQAAHWAQQSKPPGALLDRHTLRDARAWADGHAAEIASLEKEFLARSEEAIADERRRQRARFQTVLWVGVSLAVLVLSTLTGWALVERGRAETLATVAEGARGEAMRNLVDANYQQTVAEAQAHEAEVQRAVAEDQGQLATARLFAARSLSYANDRLDLALLLAVRASRLRDSTDTRASLLADLSATPYLGRFLGGHTDWVRSIAFNHDGTLMASAGLDRDIILWDSVGNEVGRLTGHKDSVYSVAFSPDGRTLVSASLDATVRLWDPVTQKSIHAPLELFQPVYSVAFSPRGDLLALSTKFGVQLWNTSTWRLSARLPALQHGPVYRVAFNQDGTLLASGSADRSVVLWDVDSRNQIATLADQGQAQVFALAFSPDGNLLVTGADDSALNVWDVTTHQRIGEPLKRHTGSVFDVAFSPDGKSLTSAGADKSIVVWGVDGQNVHPRDQRLSGYADKYYSLAFSPGGQILASGTSSGYIVWWDIVEPRRLGESINRGGNNVYAVDFSPTADVLAAATWAKVALWEGGPQNAPGKAHESLGSLKVDPPEWLDTVKFSADGKRIAAGGFGSGDLYLWDVETKQPLAGSPLKGPANQVRALAFSPDGRSLAVAGCKKVDDICDAADLRVWDLESHTSQEFVGAKSTLLSVAFNRTGSRLAAAGEDSWVMVWDVPTRKLIWNPDNGHKERVYSLAFSPANDDLLASASNDSKIMLWDVGAQRRLAVLPSLHLLGVTSVAFSPDGNYLASSSFDRTIYLWDVAARQPLYHLPSEQGAEVFSVGFSRDGHRLASAGVRPDSTSDSSKSHPLVVWDVTGDSWRSTACALAARNLNQDEWQLFVGDGTMEPLCPDPMLSEALAMARRGDRLDAQARLVQMLAWVERSPDSMNDWELSNRICWESSIEGFAAEVMSVCERTIATAPPVYTSWLKDTRALARAMVGDVPAALDDWQAFITWADASNEARAAEQLGAIVPKDLLDKRKAWVAAFNDNRNPLDAATLQALRTEVSN